MDDRAVIDILLKGNYLTEADVKEATTASQGSRSSVVAHLLDEGLITRNILGQAIAESLHVPYADLSATPPIPEQVLKIPYEIAQKFTVVLFYETSAAVTVATPNVTLPEIASQLAAIFPGKQIQVAYGLTEDIRNCFIHYLKPLSQQLAEVSHGGTSAVPQMIDQIVSYALSFRASDIHLEPEEKDVVVRFRIDGALAEQARIDKKYYENMINRIKVQAHLRMDEHFSAQDGAIRHTTQAGDVVDLRISIVPILDGEKVAMRIQSRYIRNFTLSDLGLSSSDEQILAQAAKKPFGMILVTGPTGSGKTTTLYALIKILNRPSVNITTIEDPVEYKIPGVNQIQVNNQTNLTFAAGLRTIIRQDPNIILVGEIRDEETASVAVNAALTGHLLLSTFHANDASSAIPRLLDMGTEPFLVASTLDLIVAQRLARRICLSCRYSLPLSQAGVPAGSEKIFEDITTVYRGKGCQSCGGSGFKGRLSLFELILVTHELQELILNNPSANQIWAVAAKQGSRSLFQDGLEKVKSGLTTVEELFRVAKAD